MRLHVWRWSLHVFGCAVGVPFCGFAPMALILCGITIGEIGWFAHRNKVYATDQKREAKILANAMAQWQQKNAASPPQEPSPGQLRLLQTKPIPGIPKHLRQP